RSRCCGSCINGDTCRSVAASEAACRRGKTTMPTLTVEQHWFGSAPVGLELSRGLQTVARSAGLTHPDMAWFRPPPPYTAPPGLPETDLPVNWGWFWLDDERACVHRIGYAGPDELGRPGNYLAHNLVVTRKDLDAIDFDVPCLVRWVKEKAPLAFVRT